MAAKGRKAQGVRRKSMWTDNPNFDPHWDCLWWGKKATDVTMALHPPPPPAAGKPPPYSPEAPAINPYDYEPYQWPVRAIDHTTKTEYALEAGRKPEKPTDTRTYAAPILKETSRPEQQRCYNKPLGLTTHMGEAEYTRASKFTTRSVPEPQVKELTPHVYAHPERLGDPKPRPDNVLQSRTVTPSSPPEPAASRAAPSSKPAPCSSCASISSPKPASPAPSQPAPSGSASSSSKPASPAPSQPASTCASSPKPAPSQAAAASKPASPSSQTAGTCPPKPAAPPSLPSTSVPSSKPGSPAPASGSAAVPGARPDQFDIDPTAYKSAWGGGHKDKERRKPWPKPYEKAREHAHHKTDITRGVMIFGAV